MPSGGIYLAECISFTGTVTILQYVRQTTNNGLQRPLSKIVLQQAFHDPDPAIDDRFRDSVILPAELG